MGYLFRSTYIGLICLLSFSCKKESKVEVPRCILEIIEADERVIGVSIQEVDGELNYFVSTGATAYDGFEYIYNSNCDTLCSYGGFAPLLDCLDVYVEDWISIWPK